MPSTIKTAHAAKCVFLSMRAITTLSRGDASIINMYAEKNQYLPHITGKSEDKSQFQEKLSLPYMHKNTTKSVMLYIHNCA